MVAAGFGIIDVINYTTLPINNKNNQQSSIMVRLPLPETIAIKDWSLQVVENDPSLYTEVGGGDHGRALHLLLDLRRTLTTSFCKIANLQIRYLI